MGEEKGGGEELGASPGRPLRSARLRLPEPEAHSLFSFTLALILCLLPLLLASCGGGGGEAPDVTPPSISSVSITPQLLDHNGGAVEVTAQVSDNHAAPSALAVTAALMPAAGGEPVAGPTPMSIALSGEFTAALTAPVNDSFAGTPDDYVARIAAADSSANPSSANGGTLTVQAMDTPPPPPPL